MNYQPQGRPPYTPPRKKRHVWPVVLIVIIAMIVLGAVLLGILLLGGTGNNKEIEAAIQTVQSGYLGEYTDITVQQILDMNYLSRYPDVQWDGGLNSQDQMIVEVRYTGSGEEDTVLQFTMLNGDCFKVTAFSDPEYPFEKPTDFLLALNYAYFMTYHQMNRDALTDESKAVDFILHLDDIYTSEVQYGASAGYAGSRRDLSSLDGGEVLKVSTAMLFDNYGLLDLEPYYAAKLPDEETTMAATEPVPVETAPIETEAPATVPLETEYVPVEDQQSENRLPSGPYGTNLDPAFEHLVLTLLGIDDFWMHTPPERFNIDYITSLGGSFCEPAMVPRYFANVDLDYDGVDEVLVWMDVGGEMHQILILRYQDGKVYGYDCCLNQMRFSPYGQMILVLENECYVNYTFSFDRENITIDSYTVTDPEGSLQEWVDVYWYTMDELY